MHSAIRPRCRASRFADSRVPGLIVDTLICIVTIRVDKGSWGQAWNFPVDLSYDLFLEQRDHVLIANRKLCLSLQPALLLRELIPLIDFPLQGALLTCS